MKQDMWTLNAVLRKPCLPSAHVHTRSTCPTVFQRCSSSFFLFILIFFRSSPSLSDLFSSRLRAFSELTVNTRTEWRYTRAKLTRHRFKSCGGPTQRGSSWLTLYDINTYLIRNFFNLTYAITMFMSPRKLV